MATDFKLPDVGEGVDKATIVRVLVAEGDTIQKDQSVLEIETDKATLEVPSNVGGRISSLKVKAGQQVKVGQVVFTVDANGAAPAAAPAAKQEKPAPTPAPAAPAAAAPKPAAAAPAPTQQAPAAEAPPASRPAAPSAPSSAPAPTTDVNVPAAPSVRRLAREIGVVIQEVQGTGPGGRISEDDVKSHAKRRSESAASSTVGAPAPPPLPDFAIWGEIERQPLSSIRKVISRRLAYAWAAIPHVHQNDKADITEVEAYRRQFNAAGGKNAPRLTMTVILMKLCATLLKRYPQFNATYDEARQEMILKRYCHVGVAVDTARGLLVPVIRDADKKTARAMATELDLLSAKARDGKLVPNDMSGGSFTISNLGGIGGTSFDPIINHPEVAILGVARAQNEVFLREGKPVERLMLPLCLAYDHRVIDGADGARFLADLTKALTNPYHMLVEF